MKSARAPDPDADLTDVERALTRAGRRARQRADETHTPFYVWKSGRVVDVAKSASPRNGRSQPGR